MSKGLNRCTFIGNLGRDPELRATNSGTTVATLNLAVNDRKKDRDGNWGDHVEWVRMVCFGKTADAVGRLPVQGVAGLRGRQDGNPEVAGQGRPGPLDDPDRGLRGDLLGRPGRRHP